MASGADHKSNIYYPPTNGKGWQFNRDLHQLFFEFERAYDTVRRLKLWQAIEEIRFLRNCYMS